MLLTVGAIAGPFYDRGHFRWLLVIGTFLVVFGHMMLSLCTEYWQCLLAQGFVIGIGSGCLFVPAVAIMPTYFSTKIGLALGIAASGSSTGGIIYPIMFSKLLDQVGFGWAVRILGFTALILQLIPILVMKMRVKPGKVRSLIDWTAFTDVPYVGLCTTSIYRSDADRHRCYSSSEPSLASLDFTPVSSICHTSQSLPGSRTRAWLSTLSLF
jgi:MFS family permease